MLIDTSEAPTAQPDVESTTNVENIELKPQEGPQTVFLSTPADIGVYGGAAGGGKTWALLLEFLRNIEVKHFGGVIFRRTFPQITNQGGLWDESMKLFPYASGTAGRSALKWEWPDKDVRLSFKHMQHEGDEEEWQGAQIPYIGFDELTHFTERQFFYLLSRNRTNCGVIPYMRGTCNPDPNSWVKKFLGPWLNKEYVQPNGERRNLLSGELGYFSRVNGVWRWHDKIEYEMERLTRDPKDRNIKSVVFVRSSVFDNKILLKNNPEYLASLRAQPLVDQERLLWGNWDIVEGGNMFRAEWFREVQLYEVPTRFRRIIRFWDLASTNPGKVEKKKDDPDYTVGCLLGLDYFGHYWILDMRILRDTPEGVEREIYRTAVKDYDDYGKLVRFWIEEEPGSSGAFTTHHFKSVVLKGFYCEGLKSTGSKIGRAKPVSALAQRDGIAMLRGDWIQTFQAMATAFPNPDVHDDVVDALSGAYNVMNMPDEDPLYIPSMAHVLGWGHQNLPAQDVRSRQSLLAERDMAKRLGRMV